MSFQRWYPKGGADGALTSSDPWDVVKLGGYTLPGHASITSGGVSLREDAKGGAGQTGATPTYHGLDPQAVEVKVFVWTVAQADELQRIVAKVGPVPGGKSQPIAIQAQQLQHLPIDNVVIKAVSALRPSTQNGARGWECSIQCRHWLPPSSAKTKSATVTPTRAIVNKQQEDAQKRAAAANPPPSQQATFCAPPTYTPG